MGLAGLFIACANESSLGDKERARDVDAASKDDDETKDTDRPSSEVASPDAGATTTVLPGQRFDFALTDRVYLDLSVPAVVTPSSHDSFAWDIFFDGLTAYTNGGAVGPGFGASFGPSSELDLLFDSAPAVPLRADMSDNAMLNWYWFGPAGITSRFHTYGVRDSEGGLFKVQVLSYYDASTNIPESAVYTLRYAEVTEDDSGEVVEIAGLDARAGGVTLPPSSPAACIDLSSGTTFQLSASEWPTSTEWDLCFQRTEVLLNGGASGRDAVLAVDLDLDPNNGADGGVTPAEQQQTAESALEHFENIDYAALNQPSLPWEEHYETRARIGTRWLTGALDSPSPTSGSWIVRGADGESHYALYFTSISAVSAGDRRNVSVQVKALTPPPITE
jgi:hypothetical protein